MDKLYSVFICLAFTCEALNACVRGVTFAEKKKNTCFSSDEQRELVQATLRSRSQHLVEPATRCHNSSLPTIQTTARHFPLLSVRNMSAPHGSSSASLGGKSRRLSAASSSSAAASSGRRLAVTPAVTRGEAASSPRPESDKERERPDSRRAKGKGPARHCSSARTSCRGESASRRPSKGTTGSGSRPRSRKVSHEQMFRVRVQGVLCSQGRCFLRSWTSATFRGNVCTSTIL